MRLVVLLAMVALANAQGVQCTADAASQGGIPCQCLDSAADCASSTFGSCPVLAVGGENPNHNEVDFLPSTTTVTCANGDPSICTFCCMYPSCLGSAGASGSSGTSGTSGTAGTVGSVASSGIRGEIGDAGNAGQSGQQGVRGSFGTAGSRGVAGSGGADLDLEHGTAGSVGSSGLQLSGTSGTSGLAGTGGTSGTSGTGGTFGTSGTSGTSATFGTAGTSGLSGTSGTSGTAGFSGTRGTDGTSATSGTSGTSVTSGTGGTSGTSGTAGTTGTIGTSGSSGYSGYDGDNGYVGAFGGVCTGAQSVAVVPSAEAIGVNETFTVTVTVNDGLAPSGNVVVKVILDENLVLLTPLPVSSQVLSGANGISVVVSAGTSGFALSLGAVPNFQGFAKIVATLSNIADHDCAVDSQTIQVGYAFNSWRCGCQLNGEIQFPVTGGCIALCNGGNRRRSVQDSSATVGLRVRAYTSVTYRRQSQNDGRDEDVSRCGPLVSLFADSQKVWTNAGQSEYGSEGVISGSVDFFVPFTTSGSGVQFALDIKMSGCRGFSVSVWDPHFFVESVSGEVLLTEISQGLLN